MTPDLVVRRGSGRAVELAAAAAAPVAAAEVAGPWHKEREWTA